MENDLSLQIEIDTNKHLRDIDLRNRDLYAADLSGMKGDRIDFCAARLDQSNFSEGHLCNCQFGRATFAGAQFSRATIRMSVFDQACGVGASFENARLEDSSLIGVDLSAANLKQAKLTESSFARAAMAGAQLDGAEGDGVEFCGTDLRGAVLTQSRFYDTDFRGADLRGADLSNGSFNGADFRGALLSDTKFDEADCEGAVFDAGFEPTATNKAPEEVAEAGSEDTVSELLNKGLTGLFAAHNKWLDSASGYLQGAADLFHTTSENSPKELEIWAESLTALTQGDQPPDIDVLVKALLSGPIDLQSLLVNGEASEEEITHRLRSLIQALNSDSEQPPVEVKELIQRLLDELGASGMESLQEVLERLLNPGPH
ncbi:MAG: pentapeptide repeat-containing protein [Thiohalocapsa sp. PB-PSB1]|nr:pentapeptide repeat-containing protein [Desulfofustis sp. PB-SRB1]QQO53167.1 MAG: pentapeptide repeat-containing protein [Thiohalocapsa sp. PB-PSB1]HCS91248.1 pentapeptide repeat-containing protein [Chromatiaceae bacterium]